MKPYSQKPARKPLLPPIQVVTVSQVVLMLAICVLLGALIMTLLPLF